MVEGKTGLLHGVSDGHSLEVSAVVDSTSLSVDQRVVSSWWQRSATKANDEGRFGLTGVTL